MIELVVTAPRGESWRCQAIQSDGRRCVHPAVFFGMHQVHKLPVNLCSACKAIVDAGAVVRVNASAGVDVKPVVVLGGPFDGDPVHVPADLQPGHTWCMELEAGATHVHKLNEQNQLVHVGVRDDPPPAADSPASAG